MIVYATKFTVRKAVAGVLALAAVLWGVSALKAEPEILQSVSTTGENQLNQKLETTQQQVELLTSLGWEVEQTPVTQTEVQIPQEFDQTYQEYNELQKQQGLDLEKYQGKRATLYVYQLLNDPSGSENATVSMVIYQDKLIAADICIPEQDGLLRTILPEQTT